MSAVRKLRDKHFFDVRYLLTLTAILTATLASSGCGLISSQGKPTATSNQEQSESSIVPANSSSSTSVSSTPPVYQDDIEDDGVLIDFRSELAFDKPDITPTRKQAILKAVYGKVEDAEINSIVDGAFTRASAKETVYLLQIGGPRSIDPSSLEKTKLAIFDDQKLIALFEVKNYNFVLRTSDLDKDGKSELLISGSNYQMGESTTWAKLVEVEDKRLQVVKDLDLVLDDPCDNERSKAGVRAALIKYDPANPSQISASYFEAACSDKKDDKIYPDIFKPIPEKTLRSK